MSIKSVVTSTKYFPNLPRIKMNFLKKDNKPNEWELNPQGQHCQVDIGNTQKKRGKVKSTMMTVWQDLIRKSLSWMIRKTVTRRQTNSKNVIFYCFWVSSLKISNIWLNIFSYLKCRIHIVRDTLIWMFEQRNLHIIMFGITGKLILWRLMYQNSSLQFLEVEEVTLSWIYTIFMYFTVNFPVIMVKPSCLMCCSNYFISFHLDSKYIWIDLHNLLLIIFTPGYFL